MESLRQAELLALVEAEQRHMRALLGRLKPARLAAPGVIGSWSVKNILAHITFGTGGCCTSSRRSVAASARRCSCGRGRTGLAALARINEQVAALSQAQPADVVLADFRQTSQAVYALVAGLRDAELAAPLRTTGEPLLSLILDLAYEHPHTHRLEVQDWLLRQRTSGEPRRPGGLPAGAGL